MRPRYGATWTMGAYRAQISIILADRRPLPSSPCKGRREGRNLDALNRERTHGHSSERVSAVAARAGRLVHRHSVAGTGHRIAGARKRARHLRTFRARRAHELAHASGRPDPLHPPRHRPRAELGRQGARSPPRRRGVVSAGRKALARRRPGDDDDAPRHHRSAQRQIRRVARAGDGRAAQGIGAKRTSSPPTRRST